MSKIVKYSHISSDETDSDNFLDTVDIKELEPYFNKEEFATLQTVVRECTQRLDSIHHYIESNLNARLMKD